MFLGLYCAVHCLLSLRTALAVHPHYPKYSFTNSQTIHEFPNPTAIENIAVRQNGQILVDLLTSPDIYLLDPHPNSTATLIHHFSADLALVGITETTPDVFHLIANNITIIPFNILNSTDSIHTVDYDSKTNTGTKVLPHSVDSGLAWTYFNNQAKLTFNRILVSLTTLKPTAPIELLASNITADDFALDPEKGYAYLAGAVTNQVFRVPLEGGSPEHVFGNLNSTEIPNPTSVSVARKGDEDGDEIGRRIYVTTTGGILDPVDGTYTEGGKVVSFELGW